MDSILKVLQEQLNYFAQFKRTRNLFQITVKIPIRSFSSCFTPFYTVWENRTEATVLHNDVFEDVLDNQKQNFPFFSELQQHSYLSELLPMNKTKVLNKLNKGGSFIL